MKEKELRDYQKELLLEAKSLVEAGERSFFIKSAMGTGKTVCMSEICKQFSKGKNLFIGPKESKKPLKEILQLSMILLHTTSCILYIRKEH